MLGALTCSLAHSFFYQLFDYKCERGCDHVTELIIFAICNSSISLSYFAISSCFLECEVWTLFLCQFL